MALTKPKIYAFLGSNVELIGTEVDKKCRETAAATEKEWANSGKEVGIQIWRIENFKVVPWPKHEYGQFFDGDSYIVLHTFGTAPNLAHNIHFWLGANTTADEAGTAAYKTVELDDFHKGKPVQFREIQGHESAAFLSLFDDKGGIRILTGGVASGFNVVHPEEYKPKLLHFQGKTKIRITEVPIKRESLNHSDVFVLDTGLKLYQFNGKNSHTGERGKAAQLARAIDDERGGKPVVIIIEDGQHHGDADEKAFWDYFGGEGEIAEEGAPDAEVEANIPAKKLFRLSDASGSLSFTEEASGKILLSQFHSGDVFIFDVGPQIFVWVGKAASKNERNSASKYAQEYIKKENKPVWVSVATIFEQGENEIFRSFLDGK
jgi:gelsolin